MIYVFLIYWYYNHFDLAIENILYCSMLFAETTAAWNAGAHRAK